MSPTDYPTFMWATFWSPPPPDNADRNDLIARASAATHTATRLSERQAEAVDDTPKQIEKPMRAKGNNVGWRRSADLEGARERAAAAKRRSET
jgi:hypothetical protein